MQNPAQSVPVPNPNAGGSAATLTGWILLVDDDASVRSLIEMILSRAKLTVRAAESGMAALAIVESAPTPPILLITDVMMPGIDGLSLARRMLARLPRLKVILMSGQLSDSAWWPDDLSGLRFLKKPFAYGDLILAVTEALAEASREH